MKPQLRYFLIIVFACALTWAGNYQVIDDSLIYARYIRNALQGHGLVYNIGEHVNALTSPLYCYLLLAVAKVFGGKVLLASHIIFVATWLCACFTAERLIRFAGVLVAAYGYFYIVQGMETSLFLFMLAMLVCLSNAYILRASWKIHIPVFASDYERDYTQMDNWLQQHAPEGARIATPETGFIGWQLPNNYIIDTIGLTSPENAAHIAHREPGRWLAEDHADYVVVHQPAWPYETVVENAPEYIHLPVQFGRVTLYARAGLQR